MLASPGTPCVFLKHWKAYKYDIARMIQARKLCGIKNTSTTTTISKSANHYVFTAEGSEGKLLAWIGDQTVAVENISDYVKILEGKNYSYWIQPKLLGQWNALPEPSFAEDKVERKDITIYLKDPGWTNVYFYAWDGSLYINDSWPGVKVTDKRNINGVNYYYRTFNVSAEAGYSMNIIFDKGSSDGQTVDITGITSSRCYEIASTTNKYTVRDITTAAPVQSVSEETSLPTLFDLSGRRVGTPDSKPLRKGLYITNGRKIVW